MLHFVTYRHKFLLDEIDPTYEDLLKKLVINLLFYILISIFTFFECFIIFVS